MKRACLKCGRMIPRPHWLCPECREENAKISDLAEGVGESMIDVNDERFISEPGIGALFGRVREDYGRETAR